jgi:aspartate aminotransferase
MDADDAAAIARLAHERGIYVLADECYVYLNYTGRSFSLGSVMEARDSIVILGSLSKTYAMTGWRLGYALAPEPIIKAMQKLQSQSTSNPTSIVQKAAVAALSGPQVCVEEFKADYVKLRTLIVNGLRDIPGVTCTMPEGAFYAYPNVSSFLGRGGVKSTADLFTRLLREAHVAVVPGEGFGTSQHFRISYATSAAQLQRGLERMREFFGKI